MSGSTETDFKSKLITAVKKEVKQVMEESVTRKFVHEESGCVTALCGAVEACLSQGLKRRALGLFKTSSTTALLHKIAKHCPEASTISKKVQEIENVDPNKRSSSSSDSVTKPTLKKNISLQSNPLPRYLWIRLALFEKHLAKIIDYLVSNAGRYYEKDSLVADPDYGNILSSLLVGPCALDYSRTKTPDHFWTDPPADELVQRHRIHSAASTPPSVRRPMLNFKRSLNTSSEDSVNIRSASQIFAKDYVESLHQNSRATLLFGKNNVLVLPANADVTEPMPGYLSLHQSANGLTIKWTPNQLMNGFTDDVTDKSVYWDYALQVRLDEIVYVHCHQESESGGTVILVGQDGVQRPPIHFPKGGHLLTFLSCIETGLLPRGRLVPPLWSQRPGATNPTGKRRRPLAALSESEETTKDYVFRIIDNSADINIKRNQLMDTNIQLPRKIRVQLGSSSTSSESSTKSFSIDQNVPDSPPSVCIKAVCDSMKRQIISRAFYGWLAYCRHLSTVRRHLSGLVNPKIINGEGAGDGLTFEKWLKLCVDGVVRDSAELYRLTYFGGIAHDLRKDIWPYLLGHYKFGSTAEERSQLSQETKQAYENTMSEWLAVEAIVKQKDKENQATAIAKLSSESISGDQVPSQIQRDLSNDVFENVSDYEYDPDEDQSKRPMKTKQNTIRYESDEENSEKPHENSDIKQEMEESETEDVGAQAEPCRLSEEVEESQVKAEEEALAKSNGHLHYYTPFDVQRKDFKKIDSISSTKVHCSSIDTMYSSKDTEILSVSTDASVLEKQNSQVFDIDESIPEDFEPLPEEMSDFVHNVIVTNASMDLPCLGGGDSLFNKNNLDALTEENNSLDPLDCIESHGLASPALSACVSPASSNGGIYTQELLETFGLNLHRIEKDVQRCDRNYWYFTGENLEKLRNVICTYVWEHLDIGYMQGMCDLVAPLLVIFNEESLTYACFCHLMERMVENFPNGNAMDCHFANMRSLIQILDSEMYELMHSHGDYTHFYFCYRWFLLDFKRELVYSDVYATWEVIWAAQHVSSTHFVLFLALALLETYRDIILSNSMDFTDIIKFFNEMAERHNTPAVLSLARDLVLQLQLLIENK